MQNSVKRHLGGFTLIELLVVVLIIGILSAIALPQYQVTVEKSRVAEANIILKSLTDACNRFYLENQTGHCFWDTIDISLGLPETDGILARQGKNFWYSLETPDNEIFACRGDYASGDWDYCLYYTYEENKKPGSFTRTCEGRNDFGKKVCASVCGASTTSGSCQY